MERKQRAIGTEIRTARGFGVATAAWLLLSWSTAFASPANDDCAGATPMTLDTVYTINTATATSSGDPTNICSGPFGNGVWYSITPSSDGRLTVSTCGSDFDTVLQVYSGGCGALSIITCADDGGPVCTGQQASVTFSVAGGFLYYVVVGGYAEASGNLSIVATMPPPPNDQCGGAIALSSEVTYMMNTDNATSANDPTPPCAPNGYPYGTQAYFAKGVWFTYTPTNSNPITISTCGSDFDTVLDVYAGTCGSLTNLICNDDDGSACVGRQASVRYNGVQGVTCYILVGGWYATKSGNLNIRVVEGAPPNDACSGAIAVSEGITYTLATPGASSVGDPTFTCAGAGNGVWFSFSPSSNGVATVSTCGSDYPTALQVFTGTCGALSPITEACNSGNGPACATNRASATLNVSTGTTYLILVAGAGGASGNLAITATVSPPLANDRCPGAIPMQAGVTYTRNTATATSMGDPAPSCLSTAGKGVWYSFTPQGNVIVTVSASASDFVPVLQAYSGSCASLTPVTDGCDYQYNPATAGGQASVSFAGTAGAQYLILVAGYNGTTGNLLIDATTSPPLPNDQCSGAVALTKDAVYRVNTATATGADAGPCTAYLTKAVWFSFVPPTNGPVVIDASASDFPVELDIYSGTCGALSAIACGVSGRIYFPAAAGTRYLILAGGYATGHASGNLNIVATMPPPANDTCEGAIALSPGGGGYQFTVYTDTSNATSDGDPVPDCQTNFGKGVWFTFTPPTNNLVQISTCGSAFPTVIEVFTGACGALTPMAGGCGDLNNPGCSPNAASVTFSGVGGVTYYILAGGHAGAAGNLGISATILPPPNNECSNATVIVPGVVYRQNTTYATTSSNLYCSASLTLGHGVWYRYTPTNSGYAIVSSCGSDFNTLLQVYTGACGNLYPVACNNDNGPDCAGFQASVSFLVDAGATYYVLAGGNGVYVPGGNLRLAMLPPANDQCGGAVRLTAGVRYGMNTANATTVGDPAPICQTNFGVGVWFMFTPAIDGLVFVNTCASDFDTALEVFTGQCGALTPLVCNDDGGPSCYAVQASVAFSGQAGITYWILAGGYANHGGNLGIVADVAPALSIARNSTNIVVCWPAVANGFYLQSASNLSGPWTFAGYGDLNGTNYSFSNSLSSPTIFYRLKK